MTKWRGRAARRRAADREAAAQTLERRYRRLLACYPADYRAANEQDMLGVALARYGPGRRWPDLGEAVNLIASGTRARLGAGWRAPAWRDAAAVVSILGPILLAAAAARAIAGGAMSVTGIFSQSAVQLSVSAIAGTAGWSLVALAATLRWRKIAAAGAFAGLAGQAIALAHDYSASPSLVVTSWWKLILALVIALSALVAVGSENRVLSWRPVTAVSVAAALLAAWPAVLAATVTVTAAPGGGTVAYSPLSGGEGFLADGLLAFVLIVLLLVVARLSPAIRRRVVISLLPAVVTTALVEWTFGGFIASSQRFVHPVQLTAPQWAALALVPVLGFAAGLIWLARHERMLRALAEPGPAGS
jgi:hypothetical protein